MSALTNLRSTRDHVGPGREAKDAFRRVRQAERDYALRLRAVAKQVEHLVRGFIDRGEPVEEIATAQLVDQLMRYSDLLHPWATAVARRMLADVEYRDVNAWKTLSRQISRSLAQEIATAPTGIVMRAALARQVDLITSLPREAAERVHNLALTGYVSGQRAGEIRGEPERATGLAKQILETGHVTKSRANLIARTETSRVASELTSSRAQHIGSTHFVWRSVRDADVRPRHRKLNGTVHRWDDPPVAGEKGEAYLPGGGPNCRCFAEPILPEEL